MHCVQIIIFNTLVMVRNRYEENMQMNLKTKQQERIWATLLSAEQLKFFLECCHTSPLCP